MIGTTFIASNHRSQNTLDEHRQSLVVTVPSSVVPACHRFAHPNGQSVLLGTTPFEARFLNSRLCRWLSLAAPLSHHTSDPALIPMDTWPAPCIELSLFPSLFAITTEILQTNILRVADRHQPSRLSVRCGRCRTKTSTLCASIPTHRMGAMTEESPPCHGTACLQGRTTLLPWLHPSRSLCTHRVRTSPAEVPRHRPWLCAVATENA